jgi:hypothetical protein
MVRNNLYTPKVKPCICKRCGDRYIGGKASNFCEKCKISSGTLSKKCHKK